MQCRTGSSIGFVTVAAVILAATVESALAEGDGVPRIRRIVDTAWAGGALPVIVIASDPDGTVAAALTGAPVTLAEPAPAEAGPVGQISRGIDVAAAEVSETTAALVWPARFCWVGAETVTSLIEAHGVDAERILRPEYGGEPGWPVVVPIGELETLRSRPSTLTPDALIEALGIAMSTSVGMIDLGDPGTTIDGSIPRADLPPYEGPPQRVAGHGHEWGAAVADEPEDAPVPGPAVARYPSTG
jgi:CTP:molybdopterin cytidylyltransferase MocA